jgi:Transcriptional regulator
MQKQIRMNKEDRRSQIIDSALEVFKEKGFKGATTSEIAEAASITEVTLFRYFKSKQDIFLEGITPILLKDSGGCGYNLVRLNQQERLKALLLNRITFISENYDTVRLILNESSAIHEMGQSDFSEGIRNIIERMLESSNADPVRKRQAVRLVMGSLLSFLYMPEKDQGAIEGFVDNISWMLMKTLQGDAE